MKKQMNETTTVMTDQEFNRLTFAKKTKRTHTLVIDLLTNHSEKELETSPSINAVKCFGVLFNKVFRTTEENNHLEWAMKILLTKEFYIMKTMRQIRNEIFGRE